MMQSNSLSVELSQQFVDLLSERLGGEAIACSDEFFAPMSGLVRADSAVFIEDKYTDRGKWMDGWETRRSYGRQEGHEYDWCVLRLGVSGVIHGVDVVTQHFRGNAPQAVSIEASMGDQLPTDESQWVEIVPKYSVEPNAHNPIRVESSESWRYVRLKIYPDGGVARLRIFGEPKVDWTRFLSGELIDLAAIQSGGRALFCSNMFFSDKNNLLMPGRGVNMGDGWETQRRRDSGNDWAIVKLGCAGTIRRVVVDTHHFKGNFPDRFSLDGCYSEEANFDASTARWRPIIEKTPLSAHREHCYQEEILAAEDEAFTHVRLNIFPDGGVSRLRILGYRNEVTDDN